MIRGEEQFNFSFERIDEIFNYKKFEGDPQELVDKIKKIYASYAKHNDDEDKIQKTYEFTRKAHKNQKRLSGEEYIIHPLLATEILLDLKPDIQTIQACIMHDVIEDTIYTFKDIKKQFGDEIAQLCEGVSKVSNIRYTANEKQVETLKKTFLAMAKDLRVIFLKLADRIHNIQTLYFHPNPEKRKKIAVETMKVYVPLAKKLGLFQFALYLENGTFKILEPGLYEDIIDYFKTKYANAPKYITEGTQMLQKLLDDNGIKGYEIKARLKSPYRIYEKLYKKYNSLDYTKVLDVLAFRIVAKDIHACYSSLGLIHGEWRPIIHKIKDYIAVPKFNNYQSLHTTILGMFSFPVEVQIRTYDMDEVAEYGVAAHFSYVENTDQSVTQRQSKWIKALQHIVDDYKTMEEQSHHDDFKENLNIEFLNRNIFVYTPKGDIIEMPDNSTVLDFAFRIHSDVGLKFKNALVNGVIKPINFIPQTGDVVAINIFKNRFSATKYRMDFLHTPSGRTKLQRFLKEQNRAEYIAIGKQAITVKLQYYNLPGIGESGDQLSKKFPGKNIEELYMRIADKQDTPSQIIKQIYPKHIKDFYTSITASNVEKKNLRHESSSKIIVDIDKDVVVEMCPECKPSTGDKIIARTGRDGVKIHTLTCPALTTVGYDRLMEAHRYGEKSNIYAVKILLEVQNGEGRLINVMALLHEENIDVSSLSIQKVKHDIFHIFIQSMYINPTKVNNLLVKLDDMKEDKVIIIKKSIE